MTTDRLLFTVTDLKQYAYCPRVSFYEHCLPRIRPRTYKMDAGRDAHDDEPRRAARRTLKRLGLTNGIRHFDVQLTGQQLPLTGIVDEVIETGTSGRIPIDYKLAKRVSWNHRIQLTAYALLLEETFQTTVTYGFIYLMLKRKPVRITITDKLRQCVHEILTELEHIIRREQMPLPCGHLQRCMNCEFRRFCNDTNI